MNTGTITAIHIAPQEEAPMEPRDRVQAVAGKGLEGDRYFGGPAHANLTLVEESAVQAAFDGTGGVYQPGATRRNLTVAGITLNGLVGRRFRIGAVLCEGTELAHPCHWMEKTIGPGAKDLLKNRGGLRATILSDGTIAAGDTLVVEPDDA